MSKQVMETLEECKDIFEAIPEIAPTHIELISQCIETNEKVKQAIAQLEGNKNTELAEAMAENVRAFRHKETGYICYVLMGDNTFNLYEEVMIIPNISNAAIDAAMEVKHG